MKTNDKRYEDQALRTALGRIQQEAERDVLPEGFEERLLNAVAQTTPGPSYLRRGKRYLRVAVFVGALLVSGIVLAAYWNRLGREDAESPTAEVQMSDSSQTVAPAGVVRFDNVPLDSVLTAVARHYGKQVEYRNDQVRHLRFLIEWNPDAPLQDFILLINNFEGLQVAEANDTIFAE